MSNVKTEKIAPQYSKALKDVEVVHQDISEDTVSLTKKVRVLLAEDNILNQRTVTGIIAKEENISVVIANNGEEALEALRKDRFDLVLMDIQMPKIDGIMSTQIIRTSKDRDFDPEIPIIAFTAHAFESYKQICLEAGMNGYITKPFKKVDLLKMIYKFSGSCSGIPLI